MCARARLRRLAEFTNNTTCRFLDPIMYGDYPAEMRYILRNLLPSFSKYEQKMLKNGGIDFIGLNHYTSFYIQDCMYSPCEEGPGSTVTEGYVLRTATKNGVPIGQPVCFLSL